MLYLKQSIGLYTDKLFLPSNLGGCDLEVIRMIGISLSSAGLCRGRIMAGMGSRSCYHAMLFILCIQTEFPLDNLFLRTKQIF